MRVIFWSVVGSVAFAGTMFLLGYGLRAIGKDFGTPALIITSLCLMFTCFGLAVALDNRSKNCKQASP